MFGTLYYIYTTSISANSVSANFFWNALLALTEELLYQIVFWTLSNNSFTMPKNVHAQTDKNAMYFTFIWEGLKHDYDDYDAYDDYDDYFK